MTDAATIVSRLVEDDNGIDAKAEFMRLRPEVRLLDRAQFKDVVLIDDYGPLHIGTLGPKGSHWRIVVLPPRSTGRVQRTELAKYYPDAMAAAEHLVAVMQPWWQTILYRRGQDAALAESDEKDYVMGLDQYYLHIRLVKKRDKEKGWYLFKRQPYISIQAAVEDAKRHSFEYGKKPTDFSIESVGKAGKITGRYLLSPNYEPVRVDESISEAWGDDRETIDAEAAKAEKPTSPEQAEAGNYKKGHVSVQGIPIAIENAKGSTRSGTNKQGKAWSVTMPAHYGYVKQSESKDGDAVDVYIGETPSSMLVFVINQQKEDSGAFDEHKCMLGFKTKDEAIAAYDAAFSGDLGPKLRGEVISCTIDQFKEWLKNGKTEKPFKLEECVCESARIIARNLLDEVTV